MTGERTEALLQVVICGRRGTTRGIANGFSPPSKVGAFGGGAVSTGYRYGPSICYAPSLADSETALGDREA